LFLFKQEIQWFWIDETQRWSYSYSDQCSFLSMNDIHGIKDELRINKERHIRSLLLRHDLLHNLLLYMLLEWRWWVFLIIPRKNKVFRTAIIGVYMMFHFWLGITMNLWLFPWIMITWWLALVPLQFLHKGHTDKIRNNWPSRNIQIFLWFVLVYILCRNIRTLDFNTHKQRFPYEINRIWFLLRIEQHRNMFAPFPTTEDWRFEIMGETDEWENVLLNNPTIWMHYGKNPWSHRQYVNEKRHKLYSNLRIASSSYMRKPYLQRVCTEYPDIKRIDMVFIKEQTLDNYQTGELERNHLSRIQCN